MLHILYEDEEQDDKDVVDIWSYGSFTLNIVFERGYKNSDNQLNILFEDDDKDDKEVVGTEVSLISWERGAQGGGSQIGSKEPRGLSLCTHVCAEHKTQI